MKIYLFGIYIVEKKSLNNILEKGFYIIFKRCHPHILFVITFPIILFVISRKGLCGKRCFRHIPLGVVMFILSDNQEFMQLITYVKQ